MSWTLTKDTNVITLPDPATDYESWAEKSQTLALTATGSPIIYDRQVTLHRCRVTWRDLTDSEKEALAQFTGVERRFQIKAQIDDIMVVGVGGQGVIVAAAVIGGAYVFRRTERNVVDML